MTNRYLFSHPSLNQESYSTTNKIKAVSILLNEPPMVYNENLETLLSYCFMEKSTVMNVYLNPYSHYIVDLSYATDERNINPTATQLYRIHTQDYSRFVYGPVLLVGSLDLRTHSREKEHYSVPYEMMEQLSHLSYY